MHHTAIEAPPTNLVAMRVNSREEEAEPAVVVVPGVRVGLVELAALDVRVVPAELVALAVREDQAVPAVRAALAGLENQVAPVGLAVREALAGLVVPAAAEPEHVLAVAERGHDRAVVELERALVEAVPVRGHRHDRRAVPLRTKWATALHRHDPVAVLRAAVLAAVVAQTT